MAGARRARAGAGHGPGRSRRRARRRRPAGARHRRARHRQERGARRAGRRGRRPGRGCCGVCWDGGAPAYWPWIQLLRAARAPGARATRAAVRLLDRAEPAEAATPAAGRPGSSSTAWRGAGRAGRAPAAGRGGRRPAVGGRGVAAAARVRAAGPPAVPVLLLGAYRDAEAGRCCARRSAGGCRCWGPGGRRGRLMAAVTGAAAPPELVERSAGGPAATRSSSASWPGCMARGDGWSGPEPRSRGAPRQRAGHAASAAGPAVPAVRRAAGGGRGRRRRGPRGAARAGRALRTGAPLDELLDEAAAGPGPGRPAHDAGGTGSATTCTGRPARAGCRRRAASLHRAVGRGSGAGARRGRRHVAELARTRSPPGPPRPARCGALVRRAAGGETRLGHEEAAGHYARRWPPGTAGAADPGAAGAAPRAGGSPVPGRERGARAPHPAGGRGGPPHGRPGGAGPGRAGAGTASVPGRPDADRWRCSPRPRPPCPPTGHRRCAPGCSPRWPGPAASWPAPWTGPRS